jgi:hypothetical protein
LDLLPLLPRAIDGVKTDILTIMKAHWVGGMVVGAWPSNGSCTGIISTENQSFGDSTHVWVVHIHESQSKAYSPGRELRLARDTQNRFILKGEMGNSSSFCCAGTRQLREWLEQGWHHTSSPVFSWEAGSCWQKVQEFQRVILYGEAGSGMHSHSREADFTQVWWISATLTAVEVDKTTTQGPLQWGFSSWALHSFTQTTSPGAVFFIGSLEGLYLLS